MQIYLYHKETGEFLQTVEAQKNPRRPTSFLIPANHTEKDVPPEVPDQVRVFQKKGQLTDHLSEDGEWVYKQDMRGQAAWDKDTGNQIKIEYLGELKEDHTLIPRPSINHVWDIDAWVDGRDFSDLTALAENQIRQYYDDLCEKRIGKRYPDFEKQTWTKQQQEATSWNVDNTAQTPFIDCILEIRSNITKGELVQDILLRAVAWEQITAQTLAEQYNKLNNLKICATNSEIDVLLLQLV